MIGSPASAARTAALGAAGFRLTADAAGAADLPAVAEPAASSLRLDAADGVALLAGVDSESLEGVVGRVAVRLWGALRAPLALGPVAPAEDWSPVAGAVFDELPLVDVRGDPADDDERPECEPAESPEPAESAVATGIEAVAAPTPSATANTPTRPTQRAGPDDTTPGFSVLWDEVRTVI